MSEAELIFTALAELSTRQIAETEQAKGEFKMLWLAKKVEKLLKTQGWRWNKKQDEK